MIKVIITAPKGKMDSLILEEAVKRDDIEVVAAIGPKGRDYIGTEICGVIVYDDLDSVIDGCDLVVDFSGADIAMDVLDVCLKHNKALLEGSTGFTEEQNAAFDEASKRIPLLKAANTSFMVNVLVKMLELAASKLADKCQIEIMDIHDKDKLDAPSGTAKELAEVMADAGGIDVSQITHHSGRMGDSPSTHTIYFGGMDERITITHQAYTGRCFAKGACEAIVFMENKGPGLYLMSDVVD